MSNHGSMKQRLGIALPSLLVVILFIVWKEQGARPASNNPTSKQRLRRLRPSAKGASAIANLQSVSSRYYIYDDATISQTRRIEHFRRVGDLEVQFDHVAVDISGERNMLEALKWHPLRTDDPNEAQVFIVPTPVTELLAYGCHWENCTWYDEAFGALAKHPLFQKHQGHNHVLISQSWPLFNKRYAAYMPAMSRNYRLLENVTVANHFDPFGCVELRNEQLAKDPSRRSDFQSLYDEETPVTNAFSVGLGHDRPFPVHDATYQRFISSKLFAFYHPRKDQFSYGSTKFREILEAEKFVKSLPASSIGYDLSRKEWVSTILSSKFCLVVREDQPHSYSFSNAVRAGCIPVIISDDFQAYAGPFKSFLSTNDFAIYIKEASFLENPLEELGKLERLPQDFIEEKLKQLSVAQRILMPDHPRPLFVEAFVSEALAAQGNVLPQVAERRPVQVLQDRLTLSGKLFTYRYPSTLSTSRAAQQDNGPVVITGVLSYTDNFYARHAIRESWASKHDGTVFFLVAGSWDESHRKEFEAHGDIIWLDGAEGEESDTYILQAFLHAVDTHVESYDYVVETDDESYVILDDVKDQLSIEHPDYWGSCREDSAAGYALSRDFTRCASKRIAESKFAPSIEDLAKSCGVTCNNNGFTSPHAVFYHGIENSADMVATHWAIMKNKKLGEWSVAT